LSQGTSKKSRRGCNPGKKINKRNPKAGKSSKTAKPNNSETKKTAKPQNRKTTKPQNRKTAKPQNRKTAKPQNRKTAKPQNRKTAKLQNRKTGSSTYTNQNVDSRVTSPATQILEGQSPNSVHSKLRQGQKINGTNRHKGEEGGGRREEGGGRREEGLNLTKISEKKSVQPQIR
jgi:hypothetical protein